MSSNLLAQQAGVTRHLTKQEFHNFAYKDPVDATTTASFTMASTATESTLILADGEGGFDNSANTFTLDTISLSEGDRVLIKDGVNSNGTGVHGKWNGIYKVGSLTGTSLTLTRDVDFGISSEIYSGCQVNVKRGDTHADKNFVVTTDGTISVGTTAITFTNISASAHVATTVTVTDNENTAENNLITFVENAQDSTGNYGLEMDGNFYYNPSSGTVSALTFKGTDVELSGNLNIKNASDTKVHVSTGSGAGTTNITITHLPTSSLGLEVGQLWNDGGTLKIQEGGGA